MPTNFSTDFSALFNTREQAYLLWSIPFLIWMLSTSSTRKSIWKLIKLFFNKKFVSIYVIALIYIACSVWLLRLVKIWDSSLVKDTVMWILFVSLPLMFQVIKVDSFKKFVQDIVKPLVAYCIVFEYIFGLYTFALWIELLMVPALAMLGGMLAFSERKPEHEQVNRLLKGMQSISGLIMIVFIVIHLIGHYPEYLNRMTFMQFLMPLFLSLLFLPLLYGITMYSHYTSAMTILERHFRHQKMYRYAMWMTMIRFNGDLEGMDLWKQMVLSKNLQSKQEIDGAITLVKTMQRAEKNPYTVNEGLGWSPYQVKDLLVSKGIETSKYKNNMDEEFCAISYPLKLNKESILSDTITYMVLGEQLIATELHLCLKIYYGSSDHSSSLLKFLECAEILYKEVFGMNLPSIIKEAILNGSYCDVSHQHTKILVKKELWLNKNMGYSINYRITHERHRAT